MEPASPRPRWLPPRYEGIDVLGRGGHGEAWRVRDRHLDRVVAAKFVPDVVSWSARREAAVLRLLRVPGTPRLYDAGTSDGGAWLVMEIVEGTPFPGRRTGADELCALVVELLDTLHRVHGLGIVHGDLKPSNILVPARGRAVILDFGCAGGSWPGAAGWFVGTFAYMAPEQLRGEFATPESDLYALGLVVLEACGGVELVEPDEEVVSLAERRSRSIEIPACVPSSVAPLLGALLAPRPSDRPASALEALRMLRPAPRPVAQPRAGSWTFAGPERIFHVPSRAAQVLTEAGAGWQEELDTWERAGWATVRPDGTIEVGIATITRLEARSGLLSAGLADPAWLAAVAAELRALVRDGRIEWAAEIVSAALTLAARAPRAVRRELLDLAVVLGFERKTERSLEQALYELERADPPEPDLERAVRSGLGAYRGGAVGALDELRALPAFADPDVQFWALAARVIAARSLPIDVERAVIDDLARGATSERLVQAVASWRGWLCYRTGAYADAARQLERSASARTRPIDRIADLLMASSAALEAPDLPYARRLAEDALRAAAAALSPIHEARAEWLLRATGFRGGSDLRADVELVELVRQLELASLTSLVALTEAAIAHAAGDVESGRALAGVARSEAARAGLDVNGRLATALAAACGEPLPEWAFADLARWSADSAAPELAAQVLRLLALSGRATSEVADLYRRRRAEVRPALLGTRLDVVDLPTAAGSAFRADRAHRP